MELSKRLTAVASLVTEGASVADIGTDHGYIPIYLVKQQIAEKAIALDINRGPLERARLHITGHGLKDRIETRLSDGLANVVPGEVDTMVAAGMGGALIIKILKEGRDVVEKLDYCNLRSPSQRLQRSEGFWLLNSFGSRRKIWWRRMGNFIPLCELSTVSRSIMRFTNIYTVKNCWKTDILCFINFY